jgi:hypothetical protein
MYFYPRYMLRYLILVNELTSSSRVFPEKLIFAQYSRNAIPLNESGGAFLCSQDPSTSPSPELDPYPFTLFRIQLSIVPSLARSFKQSLTFLHIFHQTFCMYFHVPHSCYMPHLSNYPWFAIPIIVCEECEFMKLTIVLFVHPPSIMGPNIQHPVLKPLSVCSSLNVRDRVSHPYKTMSKITILCVFFNFTFLDRRLWIEWQQLFWKFNLHISSWCL